MHARLPRWVMLAVVAAVLGVGGVMAATAATSSTSSTSGTVRAMRNSRYGVILANSGGLSLYRFVLDRKGVSRCSGACVVTWFPLLVKGAAKPSAGTGASAKLIGTIRRANGTRQVTYAGFPLYLYAGDTRPGMTAGEGLLSSKARWYLVNVRGALVTRPASGSPSPGTSTTTTTSGGGWG